MKLENGDWPLFGWTADVREPLFKCLDAGRPAVLGTIFALEGGAPQPVGTQMVFDGATAAGYFSGGCIEADVGNHAQEVLADGKSRTLVYGKGSPWIDIRLTCGGTLKIFLERIMPNDGAVQMLRQSYDRREIALWSSTNHARPICAIGSEGTQTIPTEHVYSKIFLPKWRLIVAGTNPVALAIVALASQCGMEAILQSAEKPDSPMPIQGVRYISGDVVQALDALSPDRWTAVIAASHDDDTDDAIVKAALASDAFYLGVLGSTRRIAARRLRLEAEGISTTQCDRIRSPVGLPNCGRSAWEVSVSIIAEILQVRNSLPVTLD